MAIIESIVSPHTEESAFLWLLRDSAIGEPHYSLQDLADLDNRVEAHLDGLRIAGDAGWQSREIACVTLLRHAGQLAIPSTCPGLIRKRSLRGGTRTRADSNRVTDISQDNPSPRRDVSRFYGWDFSASGGRRR